MHVIRPRSEDTIRTFPTHEEARACALRTLERDLGINCIAKILISGGGTTQTLRLDDLRRNA